MKLSIQSTIWIEVHNSETPDSPLHGLCSKSNHIQYIPNFPNQMVNVKATLIGTNKETPELIFPATEQSETATPPHNCDSSPSSLDQYTCIRNHYHLCEI